jgi:hypothetical protein
MAAAGILLGMVRRDEAALTATPAIAALGRGLRLARSELLTLADAAGPAANDRRMSAARTPRAIPRKADRSPSARDRLHAGPAMAPPPRASVLATVSDMAATQDAGGARPPSDDCRCRARGASSGANRQVGYPLRTTNSVGSARAGTRGLTRRGCGHHGGRWLASGQRSQSIRRDAERPKAPACCRGWGKTHARDALKPGDRAGLVGRRA